METKRRGRQAVVTLTTDFGGEAYHVGVMKGVVLTRNPRALPVDLSHSVAPGDVAGAAWILRWSWRWFPRGSVHLAVVDPGVGSGRRALAAAAGGHHFVGPDNGVLSAALIDAGRARTVALAPRRGASPPSATFHGRDVFAPAAAALSLGTPLSQLGGWVKEWETLDLPEPSRDGHGLTGEIVSVDRFGNLVTNITREDLDAAGLTGSVRVRVGRRTARGIAASYAAAAPGAPLALVNSSGHLEIACRGARAETHFRAGTGAAVRVTAETRRA